MIFACDNLSFAYDKKRVIDGVSFTLAAGEIVALLGPNGSGKSTLLRCLLGQLISCGQIKWDGKPLQQWSRRDLARRVAYLPQTLDPESSQTVADILRMGRAPFLGPFGVESRRDIDVVGDVAQTLHLADLLHRPIDQLSGGQRQRVFLGRCLVQEPAVLLLDEPNTHLDLRHQVEMGRMLKTLARSKNIAVLMALHDLNLAGAFADRLILLDEGKVAGDGPPGDVLREEMISRVYGLAMERIERKDGGGFIFPVIAPE
ncbi:MAG TPA: ABC transporter ATP-binding protein [Tepidisphaeraceae bacterium]|jgi:iron complex transport system ATP-binding protein|nr:ABC transporter ATP-binding protein [Tepidisphaeraceae bacterium]